MRQPFTSIQHMSEPWPEDTLPVLAVSAVALLHCRIAVVSFRLSRLGLNLPPSKKQLRPAPPASRSSPGFLACKRSHNHWDEIDCCDADDDVDDDRMMMMMMRIGIGSRSPGRGYSRLTGGNELLRITLLTIILRSPQLCESDDFHQPRISRSGSSGAQRELDACSTLSGLAGISERCSFAKSSAGVMSQLVVSNPPLMGWCSAERLQDRFTSCWVIFLFRKIRVVRRR